MPQPWDPEHVVDRALARELIEQQFPEQSAAQVEPFGVGFDNTAFLVNDAMVFRFPRRAVAVECIEAETRLLPAIAPRLPVAVPVPTFRGEPGLGFPWPWAGYERLAGTTACVADLGGDELVALAAPLGRFLRALHDTPLEGLDAPGDTIARADLERRKEPARRALAVLAERCVIADAAPWSSLVDAPTPAPSGEVRLLHGDLYARHVLVDDAKELAGVIDWGDVHAGDPAVDVAVAFGLLPARARDRFLDAYGAVDEVTWTRARQRALLHLIPGALYASEVGDTPLLRAIRRALDRVLE